MLSNMPAPYVKHSVGLLGLLLAGVLITGCAASQQGAQSAQLPAGFDGSSQQVELLDVADRRPLPELRGSSVYGDTLNLVDYRGRVLVLNIWASWCGPCRGEAPRASRGVAGNEGSTSPVHRPGHP